MKGDIKTSSISAMHAKLLAIVGTYPQCLCLDLLFHYLGCAADCIVYWAVKENMFRGFMCIWTVMITRIVC